MRIFQIRGALRAHRARTASRAERARAAVALVLREGAEGAELLFIERALREGDPWSGHMAFPGGRLEAGDPSARHAAERETLEEVGISLSAGEPLGRLDDLEGRHAGHRAPLLISAFVYCVPGSTDPHLESEEVTEALWVPVVRLLDPERHTEFRQQRGSQVFHFPAIVVGHPERHVVWGLTYRFVETFLEIVGQPLPDRWQALR